MALCIFGQTPYNIAAQAVGVLGVVYVVNKSLLFPLKLVQSAKAASCPQSSLAISQQSKDFSIGEIGGIFSVWHELDKLTGRVAPKESLPFGADPKCAVLIFDNNVHTHVNLLHRDERLRAAIKQAQAILCPHPKS